jgi:putative restriction endonuclease
VLRVRLLAALGQGAGRGGRGAIRWHAHGGPDEVPNGLAPCALHHRLFDHGVLTVREDLRLRVAAALSGNSARGLLEGLEGRAMRPLCQTRP